MSTKAVEQAVTGLNYSVFFICTSPLGSSNLLSQRSFHSGLNFDLDFESLVSVQDGSWCSYTSAKAQIKVCLNGINFLHIRKLKPCVIESYLILCLKFDATIISPIYVPHN